LPIGDLVFVPETAGILRQRQYLGEILLHGIWHAVPEVALKIVNGRVVVADLSFEGLNFLVIRLTRAAQLMDAPVLRAPVLGHRYSGFAAQKPGQDPRWLGREIFPPANWCGLAKVARVEWAARAQTASAWRTATGAVPAARTSEVS
jgi:hypothetical protein